MGWRVAAVTEPRQGESVAAVERHDGPVFHRTAIAEAVGAMFADRSGWDAQGERARLFVAEDRNWSSNILRYLPVYQRLVPTTQMDGLWSQLSTLKA